MNDKQRCFVEARLLQNTSKQNFFELLEGRIFGRKKQEFPIKNFPLIR
jgi:hypothetical protein